MKTKEEILDRLCTEDNHMQTLIGRAITLLAMEEYASQHAGTSASDVAVCDKCKMNTMGNINEGYYCYRCNIWKPAN